MLGILLPLFLKIKELIQRRNEKFYIISYRTISLKTFLMEDVKGNIAMKRK
jgi:hypothetical protein